MTQKIINLLGDISLANNDYLGYFERYGNLNRIESWRWTPLNILQNQSFSGYLVRDFVIDNNDLINEIIVANQNDENVGRWLMLSDAPFVWLNYALSDQELTIVVPDNHQIEKPIKLNINSLLNKFNFARLAINVGEKSAANIYLEMTANQQSALLPAITITIGDQADVQIGALLKAENNAVNLGHILLTLGRESNVLFNSLSVGAGLVRLDIEGQMHGENANLAIGAIQLAGGEAVLDGHFVVRHETLNGQSKQIVRGVLLDKALGIFDGLAYVAHGAQKTDGQQDCRYLLLSPTAKSHSAPKLEIYADDVQCAHGSTVGFLDKEALFYLQSRGIDLNSAKALLIESFLHEAIVIDDENLLNIYKNHLNSAWQEVWQL